MATKHLIALIFISAFLILPIGLVRAIECNAEFYFYKFQYSKNNITYIDRDFQRGCFPGNVQQEFYKFKLDKDSKVIYTYWFNPTILYTDVIDNTELVGGIRSVQEIIFSVPSPDLEFDNLTILDENDEKLITLNTIEIESKTKSSDESQGLFERINLLMSKLLNQLFG